MVELIDKTALRAVRVSLYWTWLQTLVNSSKAI